MADVEWGEFKFDQLFDVCKVRNKLTKQDLKDTAKTPVFSSESANNGIVGYTNEKAEFLISKENPYYLIFGDHTRTFNIATENFCVADNVKVLKLLTPYSVSVLLYIISSWKKCIPNKGYSRHWSIAKNVTFLLPTINNEINFFFMEKFIEELEEERISKLEAYLIATGLNDYILSDEEKEVLRMFRENGKTLTAGG